MGKEFRIYHNQFECLYFSFIKVEVFSMCAGVCSVFVVSETKCTTVDEGFSILFQSLWSIGRMVYMYPNAKHFSVNVTSVRVGDLCIDHF